jgi:putative SOS response-associated peptidase YedK
MMVKVLGARYGAQMCGRFVISKFPDDIAQWFGTAGPVPNSRPRYNVAPT